MFIINKEKTAILNVQHMKNIYIGADKISLKADYANGNGCQLGRYQSESEAKMALKIISSNLQNERDYVIFLPDDSYVKAQINESAEKYHHISGKKTKGHGGS